MVVRMPVGEVNYEGFTHLVRDGQKADLINGVIYMASPESIRHNKLVSWLDRVIGTYVEERGLGELTINRVAYRLAEREAPEPDVAVVLSDRVGIIQDGHVAGAPDLAIEIVSPDSVHRDYEDKRRQYEQAGVKEYWIIDPSDRTATFFGRDPSGFVELPPTDHIFRSQVLDGLWLDVRWLWQRPLPRTRHVVEQLLGPR